MYQFLIIFFINCCCLASATGQAGFEFAKSSSQDYNVDSLKLVYGNKKELIEEYELPSLLALSYYPELKDELITFKFGSIKSTAISTMTFFSVFKKTRKHYVIVFNDNKKTTGVLLNQAPVNAQVALIAHELAHLTDFKKRDFLGMASWGINYLSVKQRAKIEKSADEMVIKRGLGIELYGWIDFVLNQSTATEQYLQMKTKRYLSPVMVLAEMKKIKKK